MKRLFKRIISKRSLLGTLLLVILIGEPTVGFSTGLFTYSGLILFFFLYLTLFHLFESLIDRYKLVMWQVILLTFSIYSVFVTGFLNKELTEYALQPNLFITLIRIQASFFVAFAFYLLNKLAPKKEENILSVKQSLIFFSIFVMAFSLTGLWGIPSVIFTFQTAPVLAIIFLLLSTVASYLALKTKAKPVIYESKTFIWIIYLCLFLGAIPNLILFIVLLLVMIVSGIYILLNKDSRNHPLF